MKKHLILAAVIAVVAVLFMGGCELFGPGFEETEITGTGTFGTWTFGSGTCVDYGDGTYGIDLYPVSGDDYIMFTAPSSAEAEKLQLNLFDLEATKTVTYYDGSTNYILIDGYRQVTVDETAGTAVVKLNAWGDTVSFNGTVTLDVTAY